MLQTLAIVKALHEAGVEFVIIGGVAARVNGSSLNTDDFDVCCAMTAENMKKLIAALQPHHPIVRGDPRKLPLPSDPHDLAQFNVLLLETDLGKFDLLAEVTPIGRYQEVLAQSFVTEIAGLPTRVLSIDALIAVKKTVGRPKDQMGLMYLESAKKRREQTGQKP